MNAVPGSQATYLELSEDGGGAHKYYLVEVADTDVTITYGRIGAAGQVRSSRHPTPQKATAFAEKKIGEKIRKGYQPAVRGVRQARAVSRRPITSQRSTARRAPMLWSFATGTAAFGIFVDDHRVMAGNENGDVWSLDHQGGVTGRYQLPEGVKCLVADSLWVYAGCDDGSVYDLSGKVPHVAYEIAADVDVYWLDIADGVLGVADAKGNLVTVDEEDDFQWRRTASGQGGWMVRCDNQSIFHGHSQGVDRYRSRSGEPVWNTPLRGAVLFGWQEADAVFAGTSASAVHRLAKSDGRIEATYQCDAAVFSCATSPNGRYVFAGDNCSSVYCFDGAGARLWKLGIEHGSAYSMQFHQDRLYLVTTQGHLVCLDVSEAAVELAKDGVLPEPVTKTAPQMAAQVPTQHLEVVTEVDAPGGVVVECVQEGAHTHVRVVSPGYDHTWRVQFPKNIRTPGTRYVVAEVHQAANGRFYRARGEIRRLS